MANKFLLFVLSLILLSYGCVKEDGKKEPQSSEQHEHKQVAPKSYYTCSMHPQIREDKPGKCPICHMNLTKVEVEDEEAFTTSAPVTSMAVTWQCKDHPDVTSEKEDVCPLDGTPMIKKEMGESASLVIARVKLKKSQLRHFQPDFFPVTRMIMKKNIRLLGSVLPSEEKDSSIPARIDGRVEKVYIKSTGSFIKAGDPVVDIFSPTLITGGEEYILARKSSEQNHTKEFNDILKQSEERLRLWGVRKNQMETWYRENKVPRSITIYSHVSGIVQKRHAVVGKYFKEGQNFFELSDLSAVWVEMDVYEHDSTLIKIGQLVNITFSSQLGEEYQGEIDFINPVLDAKSRTLKVRTTIQNTHGVLKPGMIADVNLEVQLEGQPLVVPRSAIIDTGKRKVVWSRIGPSQFQAKLVTTGFESEGYVEIKRGLMEGEEVVIEGNFLLDAQAQLFGGYEDMKTSMKGGHSAH